MNLCWRLGRSTARQVYEASLEEQERDYQTVKTLLDRITAKGYLSMEKMGPLCIYEPRRRRGEALTQAIDDFVNVVLDRAPQPLVSYLAGREDLGDEDRRRLQEILSKQEAEEEGSDG